MGRSKSASPHLRLGTSRYHLAASRRRSTRPPKPRPDVIARLEARTTTVGGSQSRLTGLLEPAPRASRQAPSVLADPLGRLQFHRQANGTEKAEVPADYLFAFDSDRLRPQAADGLARLLPKLLSTTTQVQIIGRTDGLGTATHNQDLSERRAAAAAAWLRDQGVASGRLHPVGAGEEGAKPDTADPSRRRIDIVVGAPA